jgi:hypothetical protein
MPLRSKKSIPKIPLMAIVGHKSETVCFALEGYSMKPQGFLELRLVNQGGKLIWKKAVLANYELERCSFARRDCV